MHRLFLNVGYELTESQLRACFSKYGVVSDCYLPKHSSGRNKGFGFATFATEEALLAALQTPKHVVDGILVQVKRAGPRPADIEKETRPVSASAAASSHVFGKGPRLYVGGVADAVTEEGVRQHFGKWGNVTDVYFPGVKGQKRPNYCFVTFENYRTSQRACDQSDRAIEGWPLESISIAEDRKDGVTSEVTPQAFSLSDSATSSYTASQLSQQMPPGTTLPTYALWLQLQYQQLLSKLPGANPAALSYPLNPSSPQFTPAGAGVSTQQSPTMANGAASYPDTSAAFLHSPNSDITQYGNSGSDLLRTSPSFPFPVTSQSSPSKWNDTGLGNLTASQLAAARLAGYNASFQSHAPLKSPFDQSTMYNNQSSFSSALPLMGMTSFEPSQASLTSEQNPNAAWGANYGLSDPYLGSNVGYPGNDMYGLQSHAAPAQAQSLFMYP